MTAVAQPDETVIELTQADIKASVDNALRRVGCTFDELAKQARTGDFQSLRARLAWVAIGGFYEGDVGEIRPAR
ncbi:hypothetical protein [Nocardia brasiliensis]|uniref:hypothetical protein n=1 Tax=Nocardia brasiliensis TaxID=37326 RepID=UPI0024541160|nr:hypothetical protein [Nocardia brasiliensis]